jgi:hypothetical protein
LEIVKVYIDRVVIDEKNGRKKGTKCGSGKCELGEMGGSGNTGGRGSMIVVPLERGYQGGSIGRGWRL